jgi:hypothetical protein
LSLAVAVVDGLQVQEALEALEGLEGLVAC